MDKVDPGINNNYYLELRLLLLLSGRLNIPIPPLAIGLHWLPVYMLDITAGCLAVILAGFMDRDKIHLHQAPQSPDTLSSPTTALVESKPATLRGRSREVVVTGDCLRQEIVLGCFRILRWLVRQARSGSTVLAVLGTTGLISRTSGASGGPQRW